MSLNVHININFLKNNKIFSIDRYLQGAGALGSFLDEGNSSTMSGLLGEDNLQRMSALDRTGGSGMAEVADDAG